MVLEGLGGKAVERSELVEQAGRAVHVHFEVGEASGGFEERLELRLAGSFDESCRPFHQCPGPRDVAPAPVVGAGEQTEPERQLGVESEPLGGGAQVAEVAGEFARVTQADARVEQDVDEVQVGRDALGLGQPASVTTPERYQLRGVGVGEEPQASAGGAHARGSTRGAVAAGVGVACRIGGEAVVGVGDRRQHGADVGVEHRSPGGR